MKWILSVACAVLLAGCVTYKDTSADILSGAEAVISASGEVAE